MPKVFILEDEKKQLDIIRKGIESRKDHFLIDTANINYVLVDKDRLDSIISVLQHTFIDFQDFFGLSLNTKDDLIFVVDLLLDKSEWEEKLNPRTEEYKSIKLAKIIQKSFPNTHFRFISKNSLFASSEEFFNFSGVKDLTSKEMMPKPYSMFELDPRLAIQEKLAGPIYSKIFPKIYEELGVASRNSWDTFILYCTLPRLR